MKLKKSKNEDPNDILLDEEDELDVTKPVKKIKPKQKKHYVDSKLFGERLGEYSKNTVMTDELAESVYNIANRLSYAPNFINYSYKEEMIGDAIIKMMNALKNKKFNPDKGNAFSYFTKIAFNAFCNRIKKEKKNREVLLEYQNEVYNTLQDMGHLPTTTENEHDSDYTET